MRAFRDIPIRRKLILLLLVVASVVLLLCSTAFVVNDVRMIKSSMKERVWALAEVMGANSAAALSFNDPSTAEEVLASLRQEPTIVFACTYDGTGKIMATYKAPQAKSTAPPTPGQEEPVFTPDGYLEVFRPVVRENDRLGTVYLRASMEGLDAQLRRYVVIVAVVLAVSLVISLLLSLRVQRVISGPILGLAQAIEAVSTKGDYSIRVRKRGNDELGVLYDGFNSMLASIDSMRASIRDRLAELSAEVERRKEAEAGLLKAHDELERRVRERTAELASANDGLKRTAEELRAAQQAAEAASRAKSAFLATMSHEIRTPMNGVLGMAELALATALNAQQREYLTIVKSSAESLLTVINDILDFSKIEAGKLELVPADFCLREALGDTLKSLALRAHDKGLELACRVAPDVPDSLTGDVVRLRQVVVNLAGNAIKFTEQGEVVVSVARAAPDGAADRPDHGRGQVVLDFAVRDTGMGIPADKQEIIFQAFEQADSSTTRRHGGTGLGLAICSRLVAMMGGRIWVESRPGAGSTFHFTVRLGLAAPLPCPEEVLLSRVRGLPVLVVDDNAVNRRVLEEMLRAWQMSPTVASSGQEALALMERARDAGDPFPLVLLDAHMPDTDGFTVAERIRYNLRVAATTIMMLTSRGQTGDVARCRELGISAYLTKPIKQSELLDAVMSALHLRLERPSETPAAPAAAEPAAVAGHLNILLVEDNAVNQKVATYLLEQHGHRVTLADNGKEALATLGRESFDLVLMDVQMPEMDGLEATAAIRGQEQGTGRHVPIVAMTAHAMRGDRERCLAAGMDGYVSKPVQVAELLQALREFGPAAGSRAGAADPVVDRRALLARMGGNAELLREIAKLFLNDYPRALAEIHEALTRQDAPALRRAAHTLKGAVGNFKADAAFEAALRLETQARAGDLAGAAGACATLEEELGRLRPVLADLASPASSPGGIA